MKRKLKLAISLITIFVILLTNALTVIPVDNRGQDGYGIFVEESKTEEMVKETPEATPELAIEPVTVESTPEATPDVILEATLEPAIEATPEEILEATIRPAIEATRDVILEATLEPAIEATPDVILENQR